MGKESKPVDKKIKPGAGEKSDWGSARAFWAGMFAIMAATPTTHASPKPRVNLWSIFRFVPKWNAGCPCQGKPCAWLGMLKIRR